MILQVRISKMAKFGMTITVKEKSIVDCLQQPNHGWFVVVKICFIDKLAVATVLLIEQRSVNSHFDAAMQIKYNITT